MEKLRVSSDTLEDAKIRTYEYGPSEYYEAKRLLRKNEEVPDNLLKAIAAEPNEAEHYALLLLVYKKPIPPIILESVASSSSTAFMVAGYMARRTNQKIPDELIQAIAKNPYDSEGFAEDLLYYRKEMPPQIILESIASNRDIASELKYHLKKLGMPIPPIIQQALDRPEQKQE